MTGRPVAFYLMARGWMDHPVLQDAHNKKSAWAWLIENAGWGERVMIVGGRNLRLQRGQFAASIRQIAATWDWSYATTHRFLSKLAVEGMISMVPVKKVLGSPNGSPAGSARGSSRGSSGGSPLDEAGTLITICNYERYQAPRHQSDNAHEPADGSPNGSRSGSAGGSLGGSQVIKEESEKKILKGEDDDAGARDPDVPDLPAPPVASAVTYAVPPEAVALIAVFDDAIGAVFGPELRRGWPAPMDRVTAARILEKGEAKGLGAVDVLAIAESVITPMFRKLVSVGRGPPKMLSYCQDEINAAIQLRTAPLPETQNVQEFPSRRAFATHERRTFGGDQRAGRSAVLDAVARHYGMEAVAPAAE